MRIATLSGLLLAIFLPPAAAQGHPALPRDLEARIRQDSAQVAVVLMDPASGLRSLWQPDLRFHAASTMKVPVLIELSRRVESGEIGWNDPWQVRNRFASIVDGSEYRLSPADDSDSTLYAQEGRAVAVGELARLMIVRSSNLATNILIDRLSPQRIQQTSVELGAGGMQVVRGVEDDKAYQAGRNNTTTARALLVLMQAIAEGRAVSPAASKEMVEILKRQKASDGIPAGLPRGTAVAHKTGEISTVNHDAAIVYAPRPYVLVVLVRGLESKAREKLIADVSRAVYETSQQPPPASR